MLLSIVYCLLSIVYYEHHFRSFRHSCSSFVSGFPSGRGLDKGRAFSLFNFFLMFSHRKIKGSWLWFMTSLVSLNWCFTSPALDQHSAAQCWCKIYVSLCCSAELSISKTWACIYTRIVSFSVSNPYYLWKNNNANILCIKSLVLSQLKQERHMQFGEDLILWMIWHSCLTYHEL